MSRIIADGIMDILRDWSVEDLFICPGSTEAAVLDATLDRTDIRAVLVTHDSIAVSMADGFARASGKPGVAYLHANVGLTNGISHLAAAFAANSSVVLLNGLKSQRLHYRSGFTTARHMTDFVRDYVKWDAQPATAEATYSVMTHAFSRAMREPQGPVWVGLAEDVMEADEVSPPDSSLRFQHRVLTSADPLALDRAAEALSSAGKLVIVAGGDVAKHNAAAALLELAEMLGVPVLNEDRRGLQRVGIPTNHSHFAGYYTRDHELVKSADVIFFVGARCFVEFLVDDIPLMPERPMIIHSHVDPAQVGVLYGADIGLVGDESIILAALLERLIALNAVRRQLPQMLAKSNPRAVSSSEASGRSTEASGFPARQAVVDIIASLSEPDTIFVCDAVTATRILLDRLPLHSSDSYFASSAGSLGWGVGAAMGVKLALPDRPVMAISGDGSFQFGIQGLWTAARYNIDVTFIVLNNQAFAAVGAALRRYGRRAVEVGEYPGTDLSGPHLADVARGFGIDAVRVETLDQLRKALQDSASSGGPSVIEVMTQQLDWIPQESL